MTEFGPYIVTEQVATGSTATVFKAHHREIDRVAAIKELDASLRASGSFLERFRDEARVLAGFDDPHIVTLYDFVEEPERAWIAEEWVDGATIETLLRTSGRLSPEQSLGVLAGALRGLSYAHDRDVVHGDLTPANIIADLAGVSKLIDFGVSAPVGTTGLRGTPAFMSPEAVRGAALGKTSDVYSAGAVLFTLLSGRVPFVAATVEAVLEAQKSQPLTPLRDHGPAMAALLDDSMAKDPARRPPDARAFLERMEQAARERYGSDWLERASIAGLVAGVVAAGSVAATAVLSGGTAATVVGATPNIFAGSAATLGRFGLSRRTLVIATSAAVVIAGGAVAVALTVGGSKGSPPDAVAATPPGPRTQSPISTSVSITPSIVPANSGSLPATGKYRVVYVVTSTNFPGEHVGQRTVATWTVKLACTAGTCTGKIKSSSGSRFSTDFNGHVLTAHYNKAQTNPCIYYDGPLKGKKVPHTLGRYRFSRSTRAVVVSRATGPTPPAGTALRLTGTSRGYQSRAMIIKGAANCTRNNSKAYHDVSRLTVTYLHS